jgi:hypothetical protein
MSLLFNFSTWVREWISGFTVERDTPDPETLTDQDALSLLLPGGRLPTDVRGFSLHCNHNALGGWVRQRSAVCAAASTAGAWNAVLGAPRGGSGALTQDHVLVFMRALLQDAIAAARSRAERLWLAGPVAPLEAAVRGHLHRHGLRLGGDWGARKGADRRQIWASVKAVCLEAQPPASEGAPAAFVHQDPCFKALRGAWATGGGSRPSRPAGLDIDDDGEDHTEEEPARREVVQYFILVAGMDNLTQSPPTTAVFGNWGILQALRRLDEANPGVHVAARLFMGRSTTGSVPDVRIAAEDTAEQVTDQWHRLCREFQRPATALIFHLTNHFALLFALRSWTPATGPEVRQVLTARKGQRPSEWIDWEECRAIMLGAAGYKILSIHRTS